MKKVSIFGRSVLSQPEYLKKAENMIISDEEVIWLLAEDLDMGTRERFMRMPGRHCVKTSELDHLQADVCEWWRAGGMPIADRSLVKDAPQITEMTYKELRDLAYMDDDVLPGEAVLILSHLGIPIHIRNICAPEDAPVVVKASIEGEPEYTMTGIRGQKNYISVNISRYMLGTEKGYGLRALEVFDRYHIPYAHVAAGIDTHCIFVRRQDFEPQEQRVLAELYRLPETENIKIENNLAILAVIGRHLSSSRGAVGKLFSALNQAEIPIKMIDLGFSSQSLLVGVAVDDYEKAIKAIYHLFVEIHI